MGYTEVARTDLVDGRGDVLSFIVETDGAIWKLYASHRKCDKLASQAKYTKSWSFEDHDYAVERQEAKIAEAVAMGWKKRRKSR